MRGLILLAPFAALALAGCTFDVPDKAKHSDIVAVCRDGTSVLLDTRDGTLSTFNAGTGLYGDVAAGVTAAEVCK